MVSGESLFVNHFTNNGQGSKRLTLTQGTPGDVRQITLKNESVCLQPGAYLASTPGVKLGVKWAGFASGIGAILTRGPRGRAGRPRSAGPDRRVPRLPGMH